MKKVIIISPEFFPITNWGGIATFYTSLVLHLLRLNKHVEVVTISYSLKNKKVFTINPRFTLVLLPYRTSFKLLNIVYFKLMHPFRAILSTYFPESLQNFDWSLIFWSYLAKKNSNNIQSVHTSLYHSAGIISSVLLKRIRFIFHIHGPLHIFLPYQRNSLDLRIAAALQLAPLKNPRNLFIACGINFAKWFKKRYGVRKLDVIPNTLPKPNKSNGNSEIHTNLIVYWGQLEYRKGVDLLIDSFLLYKKRNPTTHLLLIGTMGTSFGDKHTKSLIDWMNDKKISRQTRKAIHIQPPIKTIAVLERVLKNDKVIAVFPSRIEPFGYSVLESLRSGHITITTNTWGGNELISHGQNGFICTATCQSICTALQHASSLPKSELETVSKKAILSAKKYIFPSQNSKYKQKYEKLKNY